MTELDFALLWCVCDFGWPDGLEFWRNIYQASAEQGVPIFG